MPRARHPADQTARVIVDVAVYQDGRRVDRPGGIAGAMEGTGDGAFLWVGLHEPTPAEIDQVSAECGLHHLLLEDVQEAHQRAKWDTFDEAHLVVLKTAAYHQPDRVEVGELQVILGPAFVITVRHGSPSSLVHVRRRLEGMPALLRHGPVAVLYGIADAVVDDYSPVIGELETDVDEAEEAVFGPAATDIAHRVFQLKRQVLDLRRNIIPLGDVLDDLRHPEAGIVPEDLHEYFQDVADHAHRVMGRVEVARELLTDALNANLAQQGVRQSEDMRRISAWAAVFAAPTLLASVWGMNFHHMPELDGRLAYPVAIAVMVGVSLGLVAYFRRVGWL